MLKTTISATGGFDRADEATADDEAAGAGAEAGVTTTRSPCSEGSTMVNLTDNLLVDQVVSNNNTVALFEVHTGQSYDDLLDDLHHGKLKNLLDRRLEKK
jgi:hypothetical protein